jgi:hypothetical protein
VGTTSSMSRSRWSRTCAACAYPVAVTPTHLLVDLAGVLATFDQEPRIAALARLSGAG